MVTLARLTLRLQERGPSSPLAQGLPVPPRWPSSSLTLPRGRPGHCTGLRARVWGDAAGFFIPRQAPSLCPASCLGTHPVHPLLSSAFVSSRLTPPARG